MYNKTKQVNNNKIMIKHNKVNPNIINIRNIILPDKITIENTFVLLKEKLEYIQKIIQKTILFVQLYKKYDIFSNSDVNICISSLSNLYEKTIEIINKLNIEQTTNSIQFTQVTHNIVFDPIINNIQLLIDKLSIIICGFGTSDINDVLFICYGSDFKNTILDNEIIQDKQKLIQTHVHPIGYKLVQWKQSKLTKLNENNNKSLCENKHTEERVIIEHSNNFECFEPDANIKLFSKKIYGIQLVIQNETMQNTLILQCMVDDINIDCFSNKYINARKKSIIDNIPNNQNIDTEIIKRIINTMTVKDILINGDNDIYKKYSDILFDVNYIKTNKLDTIIKHFLDLNMYYQRNMLINLLIYNKEDDIQYITYLLYDLITINNNDSIDSENQMIIYDSFSWKIKIYFKDVMKQTIKYSQEMINKYDINRVSLEQKVYIMKVSDTIKEKAMVKLKEIKGKSDDSGMKAKQYLEGLLKIPFNVYKKEPILNKIKEINEKYAYIIEKYKPFLKDYLRIEKSLYTTIEILQNIENIKKYVYSQTYINIKELIKTATVKQLTNVMNYIQTNYKNANNVKEVQELTKCKAKNQRVQNILTYIDLIQQTEHNFQQIAIYDILQHSSRGLIYNSLDKFQLDYDNIYNSMQNIEPTIQEIENVLDDSIYGHLYAKSQILKIIGQWISGEQSGYCFGFEGSPGIGKTSLAKKGLSKCLKDANGVSRPFAFIALGGSCNGSTLEGHSYTYVNSTWGRIVDILIETKCMNPIIYIDELDKVSKTEHGKEIIGILTHLIDSTQNDGFQDKYFSGIDIDLSKALFIFSYNDPAQIDRILLDRIHRINFENLSVNDKIVIVNKYILPEINKKMGFINTVNLSPELIEYIIEYYTLEPGVRKLKELLFDLYGCINIEILKCKQPQDITLPIVITIDDLENKYLIKYNKIEEQKIHSENKIGIINGLWANSLGKGGIISIETVLYPSSSFLELNLTGMQGTVMKESMNVAKNLAWSLTSRQQKDILIKEFGETKCQGLHIHCPEGAVSKDGPSAGTAITTAIYSLLNNKYICNDVAITGEINLQGRVLAIGGLDLKIIGGIRAGVKKFIFPETNTKDFEKFMEKYGNTSLIKDIEFIKVSNISEVLTYLQL